VVERIARPLGGCSRSKKSASEIWLRNERRKKPPLIARNSVEISWLLHRLPP
jgi:hypothetical protein